MTVAVSIILPVYNAGPFLSRALQTVLPEVADDVELVVVDDGSTDGSTDVLAELPQDDLVRVVRQPNAGLAAALRTGVALARGDVLARMDADDLNVPGRLSAARALLEQHPRVGLVSCWADVVDQHDRVVGHFHVPWFEDDVERHLRLVGNNVVHGAAVFRRELYEQVGGYRDGEAAEDYDLWLRMSAHAAVAVVPEVLYRYRIHASSITGTSGDAVGRAARRLMDDAWRRATTRDVPGVRAARARHRRYVREAGKEAGDAYFDSLYGLAGEARLRGRHDLVTRTAAALLLTDPSRSWADVVDRVSGRRARVELRRSRPGSA